MSFSLCGKIKPYKSSTPSTFLPSADKSASLYTFISVTKCFETGSLSFSILVGVDVARIIFA